MVTSVSITTVCATVAIAMAAIVSCVVSSMSYTVAGMYNVGTNMMRLLMGHIVVMRYQMWCMDDRCRLMENNWRLVINHSWLLYND